MQSESNEPLRLAIAGLGAIGMTVARRVDQGGIEGMKLVAVSARDTERAAARVADFKSPPQVVTLEELADVADIIVECVPAANFSMVANAALEKGRIFMPLSVGAMLEHMDLVDLARKTGGKIVVPTGALIGLDAVRAAASAGDIQMVKLTTRKPPGGLKDAPYVVENAISLDGLNEAKLIFSGTAREAAKGFPANLNVGVALALAGVGPDETQVEIWADPAVNRNIQSVEVSSNCADFSMTIQNVPTDENPRTGRITAYSVLAALQRMTEPLVVGS